MKKNVLVTLADDNYIDQAKQLFSSVYFKAGWKGDYMLLAYRIPEEKLQWFMEKGIIVKRCPAISSEKVGGFEHPPAVLCKFYLFSEEFKKWEKVVYLDADIIVRASLDDLLEIEGFGAYSATRGLFSNRKLIDQFSGKSDAETWNILLKEYGSGEYSFNTGVMVLSTDIIRKDSLAGLKKLLDTFGKISTYGEEGIINLFMFRRWKKIPQIFNNYTMLYRSWKPEEIDGAVLHFVGKSTRPWNPKNHFHKEWRENLAMAELIDLGKTPSRKKKWRKSDILVYTFFAKLRNARFVIWNYCLRDVVYAPDRIAGLAGMFLKRHRPRLYRKIILLKSRIGFV